jgi:hypothetical protein
MGMLPFLPWICVDKEYQFAGLELFPYRVGSSQEKGFSDVIDQVLKAYQDNLGSPVQDVTLIKLSNRNIGDDLLEEEIDKVFAFEEIFTFSALSERRYFEFSSEEYINSDTCDCILQRFTNRAGTVGVYARRRDGLMQSAINADSHVIRASYHITTKPSFSLNKELIEALIQSYDCGNWHLYEESLSLFNRGNTDNDTVQPRAEIIAICGAFERFLGSNGKEHDLSSKFLSALDAMNTIVLVPNLPYKSVPSLEKEIMSPAPREDWIRKFFSTRGSLGHGYKEGARPSKWTLSEHLLLGAFIFPLLVKLQLQKEGLYQLTTGTGGSDQHRLMAIDHLVSWKESLFPVEKQRWYRNNFPWHEAMEEAEKPIRTQELREVIEKALTG